MAVIDQERLRTAVVGCGSTGTRRAAETSLHSRSRLLLCIDSSQAPARNTAERYGAAWSTDWRIATDDERIDVVVVCTPAALAFEIASAAIERGKHVLVERPGCDFAQLQTLASKTLRAGCLLKVGLNHRYHPAVSQAHELTCMGEIGDLVSIRVRYDEPAGAADLVMWFAGEPYGTVAVDVSAPEACANVFSLELRGSKGAITVDGLGDRYGVERLAVSHRDSQTFDGPDRSWAVEWHQFVDAIERSLPYWGTPDDALAATRVANALTAARSAAR